MWRWGVWACCVDVGRCWGLCWVGLQRAMNETGVVVEASGADEEGVACGALPYWGVGEGLWGNEGEWGVVESHVRCELAGEAAGEG